MNNLFQRIISSIILIPLVIFCINSGSFFIITLIFFCFTASCYEWYLMSRDNSYQIYGWIFLVFSFITFYELSREIQHLYVVIFICIITDIGGYVFGKILKGPKLIKISPNKTYAGMFGSYLLTLFLTPLFFEFVMFNNISLTKILIISFIISSISQIGDIVISFFKRKSKIKNTGKLIPGHGGILDRIDGMIFAVPFFYILDVIEFF